jgi:transcriptional regulator with XRE-family HTH domain/predicted RNase H-like HicB family nuclease
MKYPAIITREGEFTLAEFPDCEGCQTYTRKGENIEEAAREALEGWLEANLGRDTIPNRPGTTALPKGASVREIEVPLVLTFRLELRWLRAETGKTQAEFGRNLGMSQQQYARLEGSGSNPTLGTLDRVAKVAGLGISVTKVGEQTPSYYSARSNNPTHKVGVVSKKVGGQYATKTGSHTSKAAARKRRG